jgi:hypothetical protein
MDFIFSTKAGKPWFVWWNGTRMHFRTHVKKELRGISGQDEYSDGMVEHDRHIGLFLKKLDDLNIADNTLIWCTISLDTVSALILPGQRTIAGTRQPPSQLVFFSPRNGVIPASGQVLFIPTRVARLPIRGRSLKSAWKP